RGERGVCPRPRVPTGRNVMTADFALLLLAGILSASGVYLLLERAIIKILLGIMILSNGINLLILSAGGAPGNPPIRGREWGGNSIDSDPLAQAMIRAEEHTSELQSRFDLVWRILL